MMAGTDDEEFIPRTRELLRSPLGIEMVFNTLKGVITSDLVELDRMLADSKYSQTQKESMRVYGNLLSGLDMTNDIIRSSALNQVETTKEVRNLVSALKSETMTKEEVSAKLEEVRKELAIPEEDKKNIEWVRKYLERASGIGGNGS